MSQPTAQQLELIEQQLGRKPRGLAGVAVATDSGVPLVLQMQSLVEDQPFPTLFWLSSKDLYQAIAEIETSGWVKQIEAELETNTELREAFLANQQDYVDLRWKLMRDEDRLRIEALGFTDLFNQYGIGGIRHWDKVRCLHMQYAHHLAAGNVIGARLDEEFGLNKLTINI
ncbi:DUF501 domain-containing protein [Pontibacterium granulatum]|uniref:DUF501 domain-containing protein n=1 Tax=Pontibacterium granulatum TaxID=2036029 RepID=UPI00249B1940|nr:DUF501 domain-containing protein [Pontibacterium granulatum]MDI3324327.1 DUF501 domain-containing protein [Pontibacterium granulatum]